MDTNPLTLYQLTNYLASNPVQVAAPGMDYPTALALYLSAFTAAVPIAVAIAVCALIVRGFKRTEFPGSDRD